MIAQRRAIAHDRLMAAARKLGKQYGLKAQHEALEAAKSRDPEFERMLQTEALADLLEGVTGKSGGVSAQVKEATGEEPPKDEAAIEDAKAETDAPLTVEVVDEKPLVTTEAIETVPPNAGLTVKGGKRAR